MEIGISSRTARILEYLLKTQGVMNTAQIASNLQLSLTQVRYSLDQLDPWLRIKGFNLTRRTRVGIFIKISEEEKSRLLATIRDIENKKIIPTTQERRQFLLFQLLLSEKPILQDNICQLLDISQPTLSRDIAFARFWFEQREIKLQNLRMHGLKITYSEYSWRETALELILQCIDQNEIMAACAESVDQLNTIKETRKKETISPRDFIYYLPLKQADRLVNSLTKIWPTTLTDYIRIRLILCISLILYRFNLGKTISYQENNLLLPSNNKVKNAVKEIKNEIEAIEDHKLPNDEIYYLNRKISDSTGVEIKKTDRSNGSKKTAERELAALLVNEAAKYLHAGLLRDQDLMDCLSLELSQFSKGHLIDESIEQKLVMKNVENKDPLSIFTNRIFSPILINNGWTPTLGLLNAISIHLSTALIRLRFISSLRSVLIVCGSGLATSRNLVSRLKIYIPELRIAGVASFYEVLHDPNIFKGLDAIISTIKLNLLDIPVIQVNPLLIEDDIEQIRKTLGLDNRFQIKHSVINTPEKEFPPLKLLTRETIEIVVGANSWEKVVEMAGNLLLKAGAIWPSYIKAMIDMISLYGPYMVIAPGVALLHAGPEMGAKRLAISLVLLRKPVPFGHKTFDPITIAFAFSSVDHFSHFQTINTLMELLGNKTKRDQILASSSKEDLLTLINL